MSDSSTRPKFEIVRTTAGAISIRNNIVNEIMHNPVGPWLEANALYIEQSSLEERLLKASRDLVVFDVGLGAAANALAALHARKRIEERKSGAQPLPSLRLVSFERDLELLEFALAHADQFDHFRGFEPALRAILSQGEWQDSCVNWSLRHGDFLELIGRESEKADVIFYDPYSPRMNVDMWTLDCFRQVRARAQEAAGGCSLYTYSRATPIRVALLCAGFYVGVGTATGLKDETTIASTDLRSLAQPLDARWLERWRKSHTPYPLGLASADEAAVREQVQAHPQFR